MHFLDFGPLGLSSGPSFLLIPPRLIFLVSLSPHILGDFGPTCMSDRLSQDLRDLTQAIQQLTLVTRDLVAHRGGASSSVDLDLRSGGNLQWELVQESTAVPGVPEEFLRHPPHVAFEQGPPETPEFCIQLAKKHLSSSKSGTEERAREAYRAGFWLRAFWTCHTDYQSTYRPGVAPRTHWVLRKGDGLDFVRTTTQADSDRLERAFPDIVFVEKFPTLTELHIFCAGASIAVPPLWRWTASQ